MAYVTMQIGLPLLYLCSIPCKFPPLLTVLWQSWHYVSCSWGGRENCLSLTDNRNLNQIRPLPGNIHLKRHTIKSFTDEHEQVSLEKGDRWIWMFLDHKPPGHTLAALMRLLQFITRRPSCPVILPAGFNCWLEWLLFLETTGLPIKAADNQ